MTNFEYHEQEIKDFLLKHGNTSFAVVNNEVVDCCGTVCSECEVCGNGICNHKKWLNAEHNPYTIPADTPIDTKVLVSYDGVHWEKRYFSHFGEYRHAPYVCFGDGSTSWSAKTKNCVEWRYCKLWREGDESDTND